MKIELIKDTAVDGALFYYIKMDSNYVRNTMSSNLNEVEVMYQRLIESKGKSTTEEVIKEVEI